MSLPVRKSVKVLLINQNKELLLMCADDPKTRSKDNSYHGRFWFPIGGKIEEGENLKEAALREIYEETSLTQEQVEIGPVVWHGEFDMILDGTLSHLDQTFIVATTKKTDVKVHRPCEWEKKAIKCIKWFTLEEIKLSKEPIFPVILKDYLPDILNENYPSLPIEVDLGRQPV